MSAPSDILINRQNEHIGTLIRRHQPDLGAPVDFTSPDALVKELLDRVRKYHPSDDLSLIEKACKVAEKAHDGQLRKSGEPYIIHPLCVGIILADLEMDKETIAAGILHDVVEDTTMSVEEIREEFGDDVALLVDGVTKLGQVDYKVEKVEIQAENLRKMFLAMAKDIRVIIIKLADRLHNMRTLEYMRREKQLEKASETMDIYAPLAQRLGISRIKVELDDLALQYWKPGVFQDLVDQVNDRKVLREEFVEEICGEVRGRMESAGIRAEIKGRVKHYFSIYKKMVNQDKTLDQIYDLFAIRIIVDSVSDCYAALGLIHDMYKPIPGRFKDYIAMPKENMYQSLHTTVIGKDGTPFEIQIRTKEMHRIAEYGIAAHWKYKEASDGRRVTGNQEEEKLTWLRQILEWQQDSSDNKEFMSLLKSDLDLFSESVYCFSPQGDVKTLPNGSCPIDFAYSVHSAVGNRMIGARVNDKLVPMDYVLKNGDRVEIITSQNSRGPSRDWLKIVKSTQARNKINQWFRRELKTDNIEHGKELVAQYIKSKGYSAPDLMKAAYQNGVLRKYGFHDWDSLLAAIGHGGLKEGQVVNKLIDLFEKENRKKETDEEVLAAARGNRDRLTVRNRDMKGGITVEGLHDVAVHFAKCCSPIPGDEIVGYVTRGRGVTIHRTDCVNLLSMSDMDRNRLIDAEWQLPEDEKMSSTYAAEINLYADNRTGLLVDISRIFTERKIDIGQMNVRTNKQGRATMEMSFNVHSIGELNDLVAQLRQVPSVIDIERKTG
ncbi:MAG: bifunctional (p)ppGpp synthetase/guanosine-3',5'-bis(diphosphate) 3'-pyrophosphohydrolase [Lachnospiraceae bacterium]|nr:bifunctional (p)ppGpp synthetase/guanosine-3',5'-bis(diphosphate) 3'-pyrophosphohydrolase [Lachnospiraceae bacterium]